MDKFSSFVVYLLLNFGCLGVSRLLMNGGLDSEWYLSIARAPWTPPGWAFGVAWSLIMICFACYMLLMQNKCMRDYVCYGLTLLLCMGWNYAFFYQQHIIAGLVVLIILTAFVLSTVWRNLARQGHVGWLMLPFCVWTPIAVSLNAYSVLAQS